MKLLSLTLLASVAAAPLMAQDARALDAHEHGVSTLQLALEGSALDIAILGPGMDIVGFEYPAASEAEKAAVAAAIATLQKPETIVTLPAAAACQLVEATAGLQGEAAHEADDPGHSHDDHHDDHAEHSAFEAHYRYACEHPEALTELAFPFFAQFPQAQEIEAEYITNAGSGAAEIARGGTLALQ